MRRSAHNALRILVVDDEEAIHDDYRKILSAAAPRDQALESLEADLLGARAQVPELSFEVDSAFQGQQGLALVEAAHKAGRPYALAFVDMRMPPGWDGVETVEALRRIDPQLQVVLCTAYSDYSWHQISGRLKSSENLMILKKPFAIIEVRQMAASLGRKWELRQAQQRLLATLETQVQERTRALEEAYEQLRDSTEETLRMERALHQARKLEALGQLTAGISHEINNPLTFVLANLDFITTEVARIEPLLEEGSLGELSQVVSETMGGVVRIKNIVQDVKLFARPDQLPRARVSVREVLQGALKISGVGDALGEHLVLDIEGAPDALADHQRLEQIFVNLLTNALQAARPDTQNEILVVGMAADDESVVVEIKDRGHGIAPELVESVFEPFFSTRAPGEGTGLGLAICQSLLKAMGGHLSLAPRPGGGTIAKVTLRGAHGVEAVKPTTPPPIKGPPTRKASVLIVDDERLVALALARLLPHYEIRLAVSVDRALEIYDTEGADVVLCDLMMPERNGMDLYEALAAHGPEHSRRVIFITGGVYTPEARQFLEQNPCLCLRKPSDRVELEGAIEARLEALSAGLKA